MAARPEPSIPARLLAHGRQNPSGIAYREKVNGQWISTSWASYASQVRTAARALASLGLNPGDRTCILGFNRPEWSIFDLATMTAGAAPAGIYTTSSPDEVAYIAGHTAARIILVENKSQFDKVASRLDQLPDLQYIVTMRGTTVDHPKALSWDAFLAKADTTPDTEIDARLAALKPDSLATLIYTSGTTAHPKGVMLSHDNLAWTASQVDQVIDVGPADRMLSYLPLSHIAEQVFTLHGPATFGYEVWYAEALEKLPDNLKEARPTIFFGVPRVWEKLHTTIRARLDAAAGPKGTLGRWAVRTGSRVAAARNAGKSPGIADVLQHRVAEKLVLGKVRAALGLNAARVCISGAAPIGPDVLSFLAGLGLTISEVYGQSEGTGPSSFNRPDNICIGSVGTAFPGTDVRIADDGEILVKGRNVFLGYYKDPAATAETLVDGWLHSGDLGRLDDKQRLWITGRKKEILITAGGKNIAPVAVETVLKEHPLITEAVLIGDRRPFLAALIVCDPDRAKALDASAPPHESAVVRAELERIVAAANERFARVEQVRKFAVLPRALSQDFQELTPTMKVRRRDVVKNWATEIEGLYS